MKLTVDIITSGNIPTTIPLKAECENVSSIIIGSRGEEFFKGLLPGSVSADILRYKKTHLLIFRHSLDRELRGQYSAGSVPGYLPVYYSPQIFLEPAKKALPSIKEIEGSGEVHILHVVTKGETHEEIGSNVFLSNKET